MFDEEHHLNAGLCSKVMMVLLACGLPNCKRAFLYPPSRSCTGQNMSPFFYSLCIGQCCEPGSQYNLDYSNNDPYIVPRHIVDLVYLVKVYLGSNADEGSRCWIGTMLFPRTMLADWCWNSLLAGCNTLAPACTHLK
uniref:Uncharacterized protein n=1 Tax=Cacopsylla melanoneura TaxID=428564 RepID=A0A8D8TUP3_9HEMI